MSAFFKRKDIQVTIVGISFLIVFLPYFFNVPSLQAFSVKVTMIASLVNAFTLALAIHAQFRRAINAWRVKSKGWGWGIYMLIALILMILFGLYGQEKEPWHFILFGVINPLSSVNYSILAFYMSSAAARAFRARNLNATLLLLSGFIVLLYQAPMTGAVFPAISPVALYITGTFAMAYARVITMGTTVASIVLGVRMLTGREVSFLGFARESD